MISLSAEQWPLSGLATAAVVAVTLYALLYQLQFRKHDPDEPPVVASPLPFVGHLLGMAWQGGRYVKAIGLANRDKPAFTLPVPGSRIYVVTDPALAAAVQRARPHALSFTPLVPDVTARVLGLDAATVRVVRANLDPEPGAPRGFLADMHDMVYARLGPGKELEALTARAAGELVRRVDAFADGIAGGERSEEEGKTAVVDLLEWTRHLVTVGTARFLYGPRNPLAAAADPDRMERAFWDFAHGLGGLLLGVAPSVTAPRAYRAREALVREFIEYLSDDGGDGGVGGEGREDDDEDDDEGGGGEEKRGGRLAEAAPIVRERVRIARAWGWDVPNTAREELSFLFAGIINTAVASFWVVLHVFARPGLLDAVRAELAGVTTVSAGSSVTGTSTTTTTTEEEEKEKEKEKEETTELSIEGVRARCPTLAAVFRETLRLGSDNFSTRLVKEDTALQAASSSSGRGGQGHGGRCFFKAGSVVQVAAGVIHADEAIWGADAGEFNPARFLKASPASSSPFSSHPSAASAETSETTTTTTPPVDEADKKQQQQQQQQQQRGHQPVHPAAFRAFGGGKTLCPGRHFATAEILVFAAAVLLTFDAESAAESAAAEEGGGGPIPVPRKNDRVLPVHILEPAPGDAPRVRLRVREGRRRPLRVVP